MEAKSKESKMDITTVDGVVIVSFGLASLDNISGVEEMSERLRDYITVNRPGKMVIDFAGVRFFSSTVLGLLVDVWRRLKEYEGQMLICGINPQLNRVFKITNLDKIFAFYPDKDSAVEVLGRK
jgi:anti-sigma B factor antagonist